MGVQLNENIYGNIFHGLLGIGKNYMPRNFETAFYSGNVELTN